MILIDWDPSGLGNAILDLGRLLLHAHQTLAAPNAVPEMLSPDFIHAVVDGYCEVRMPTLSERAVLLELFASVLRLVQPVILHRLFSQIGVINRQQD
jgi:hypothetical protein